MIVPPHRSGKQPRLEQDLKAVADADDQFALFGRLPHPFHHRGEAGQGPVRR